MPELTADLEADLESARLEFQRQMKVKWDQTGHEPVDPAPALNPDLLGYVKVFPTRELMLTGLPKGGRIMEIGTWAGTFAAEMLRVLEPRELHVVDIDLSRFEHARFGDRIGKDVFLHEGDTKQVLARFDDESFDFVYVDGDHSYSAVRHDLLQALRLAKIDGYIGVNDYTTWCACLAMPFGVMKATNEVLNEYGMPIRFMGLHHNGNHDIVIEKRNAVVIPKADIPKDKAVISMLDEARNLDSFQGASELFRQKFGAAAATPRLPELLRASMQILSEKGTPHCVVPYAFAYGARCALHDPQYWVDQGRGIWQPKDELRTVLDAFLSIEQAINSRDNYYYEIIRGIRQYIFGDRESAFQDFASAARYADFYRIVRDDLGGGAAFAKAYPTSEAIRNGGRNRFVRVVGEIRGSGNAAAKPELVVSVGGDQLYLRAFGPRWIEQIAQAGMPGVALHIHCMFVNTYRAEIVGELLQHAAREAVQLYLTDEVVEATDRAYYASARFLHGASLLETLACPMLFADADAHIGDAEKFKQLVDQSRSLTEIHGIFCQGPWNGYLPWRKFSATWLFVPHSDFGRAFMQLTGNCIEYFWDERSGRNWWIDQMALEVARTELMDSGSPNPGFVPITVSFPNVLVGTEEYKMAGISALPEMQELLKQGYSYWSALSSIQNA